MIRVYPTKIEAYDEETKSIAFTIELRDSFCAEVNMRHSVTTENIDKLTAAMRRAVSMLELAKGRP